MRSRTGYHAHSLRRLASIGASIGLLPLLAGPVAAATPLFEPFQAHAVGSWPEAVAIGDVNGDGRADVVLTTSYYFDPSNDYRLFVFTQSPDGRLSAPVSYSTAATYQNRPKSVAVADVTGDGRADVVLGLAGLGIEIFPQTSAGLLGTPWLVTTADSDQVRLGNLNGDGALDIAGVGWGSNTVSVFLNDGHGAFGRPAVYDALHGGYDDLEIADVSGDGRDDLVVMSGQLYADPNVSVLAQLPAGGFGSATSYTVGSQLLTAGIGVGDVTGDGRNDVVASYGGNRPASAIAVFGQTAGATLAAPASYPSYDCPEPVAVADVDGDGRADVVTLHGGWNRAGVYRSRADGTLAPEELYAIPYATHYGPGGLAVGDFTGDGRPDVAIADYNQGLVVLPSVATPPPPVPPSAPQSLTTSPNLSPGVGLTWAAPGSAGSSPITAYRVYRGTASGAETPLVTLGNVLTFTDTAAANGTTYWYQVAAISAAGEGPRSAEAIAQRGTAPGAPLAPSAVASKTSIAVKWSVPATNGGSPITGYRLYRGTSPGAETLLVGVAASKTSYTDASVARKTRYYYRLTATNALGESTPSAEVSATTK